MGGNAHRPAAALFLRRGCFHPCQGRGNECCGTHDLPRRATSSNLRRVVHQSGWRAAHGRHSWCGRVCHPRQTSATTAGRLVPHPNGLPAATGAPGAPGATGAAGSGGWGCRRGGTGPLDATATGSEGGNNAGSSRANHHGYAPSEGACASRRRPRGKAHRGGDVGRSHRSQGRPRPAPRDHTPSRGSRFCALGDFRHTRRVAGSGRIKDRKRWLRLGYQLPAIHQPSGGFCGG